MVLCASAGLHFTGSTMRTPVVLVALLLVALLSAASAALVPRRMMLDHSGPCEDICEKQWQEGVDKCEAGVARHKSIYGDSLTERALDICKGQQGSKRDKCEEACNKPPETPAGTVSAVAKPQAAPPDSADPKTPVETGTTDPKPAADSGTEPGWGPKPLPEAVESAAGNR
jgi:hypothetical protein